MKIFLILAILLLVPIFIKDSKALLKSVKTDLKSFINRLRLG